MNFTAPAKINLSLKVRGKRADGFHELETVVLPLPGLVDHLKIVPATVFSLHCDSPGVPLDESNLVTKALRIFEKNTGRSCPYRIVLEKKIPHGAGLGGGSSDAARTLLALNSLNENVASLDDLTSWAGQLGSDVPLFLYDSPCRCSGRGEMIEPIDLVWKKRILLFKPDFGIPTPWAYSRWSDSQELEGIPYQTQAVDGQELVNDLERPVFEKYLFLAELKNHLLSLDGVAAALMSGSGSTVFAVLEDEADAESIRAQVLAEFDPTMWTHLESSFSD